MSAGTYNIVCEQGATFTRVITWRDSNNNPINLTTYTARMQVRDHYSATTTALSLTTENGGITLGGALGTVTLLASATTTAALVPDEYVYDLELINGSTVTRLIEGTFVVSPEVTR